MLGSYDMLGILLMEMFLFYMHYANFVDKCIVSYFLK
jgi:hypothetical protein